MMQSCQAAIISLFKHRKIDHPKRGPFAGVQIEILTQFASQGSQRLGYNFGTVRAEKYNIAIFSGQSFQQCFTNRRRQEFYYRRLQPLLQVILVVDLDIGQSSSAIDTDESGIVINLFTAQLLGSTRNL